MKAMMFNGMNSRVFERMVKKLSQNLRNKEKVICGPKVA